MNQQESAKLLQTAKEAAVKAGVYDKMFIGFGTLLGAVRPTKRRDGKYYLGIMPHDHDMDLCILPMEPAQKEEFYKACCEMEIWGDRAQRTDAGLVWMKIKTSGANSCVWFMFEFDKFMFHSKGRLWLLPEKFRNYNRDAIKTAKGMCLGAPAKYFTPLIEIDFEGVKINAPLQAGSLLDYWYTNWLTPKGGSSEKKSVLRIGDWRDKNTWRLI